MWTTRFSSPELRFAFVLPPPFAYSVFGNRRLHLVPGATSNWACPSIIEAIHTYSTPSKLSGCPSGWSQPKWLRIGYHRSHEFNELKKKNLKALQFSSVIKANNTWDGFVRLPATVNQGLSRVEWLLKSPATPTRGNPNPNPNPKYCPITDASMCGLLSEGAGFANCQFIVTRCLFPPLMAWHFY